MNLEQLRDRLESLFRQPCEDEQTQKLLKLVGRVGQVAGCLSAAREARKSGKITEEKRYKATTLDRLKAIESASARYAQAFDKEFQENE